MQTAEIYDRLTSLFEELFAVDGIKLSPEMTADDVEGWDSFNHLSVIVAVETRFGIKLTTSEIDNLSDIGQLIGTIQGKLP